MTTDLDQWLAETADLLSNPEPPDDWTPPRTTQRAASRVAKAHSSSHVATTHGTTSVNPQGNRAAPEAGRQQGSQANRVGQLGGSQGEPDQSAVADQLDAEDLEDEDGASEPVWSGYLEPTEDADELRRALAVVLHHCDAAERRQRAASGKRARTAASLRIHHAQIRATVCLAAKCLHRGVASFRVPMRNDELKGKRTRYTDPLLTPNLRIALDLLLTEEFLMQVESSTRPRTWRFGDQKCNQPG